MKVLATFVNVDGVLLDIVEGDDGSVHLRKFGNDESTKCPVSLMSGDLAHQVYEANQLVETLPLNKRSDRITLGSEWWRIWKTTNKGDSLWEQIMVTELRYQSTTVEVLGSGRRSVVEIDQLFKEKLKLEELKEEEKLPMYGRDRLARCGQAAIEALHLDKDSDSPDDVRQAINCLKRSGRELNELAQLAKGINLSRS